MASTTGLRTDSRRASGRGRVEIQDKLARHLAEHDGLRKAERPS
ncbi:hypothetical protein [Amycolatopsis sp. 195334CR]|nr:hypothetical protein [Amycolatopsis sp. 195334CR]